MATSVSRRTLAILLSSVLWAGCSEPYVRPVAPIPSAWPDELRIPEEQKQAAAKVGWSEFFDDPRLRALIETALKQNRDLRIAVARIEEARAQHGMTSADKSPQVNLGSNYNQALTPGGLGGSDQSVTGKRVDVSLSLVSYEIDFWSRLSGLADAAKASYLASEEAVRSVQLSLISDIANAYFVMLELDERIELMRESLEMHEQTLKLVTLAHAAGYASKLEHLQVDSAVNSARSFLATLERDRLSINHQLQYLVGGMPSGLPPGRDLAGQGVALDLSVGLPSEVILARPDVLAAEQRLAGAHANIGAARAAFLPRILLTGLLGTASQSLAGLFATGSKSWVFQPSLSLPIFDGGRAAANVDLAEARKIIAVAEYEKVIQMAFREVSDLLAIRSAQTEQLRAAQANLQNQEKRLGIALKLFKGGQVSYLNVLDAHRERLAAEQLTVQLRRNQLSTATQLYKALGGGA